MESSLFLILIAVFCLCAVVALGVASYLSQKATPVLERRGHIVAKRQDISSDLGVIPNTTYFVTFEFEGEEREEYEVKGGNYGLLIEKDEVFVSTQGEALLSICRSGQTILATNYAR